MRLIDADKLLEVFQRSHDFFVDAYGGFENLPPKEKARVDEITTGMARVINMPTVDAISTDLVFEIVDSVGNRAEAGDMDAYEVYTEIRQGILALKGEHG